MRAFFASGHAIDLVLTVMAVEVLYLTVVRRRPWSGVVLAFIPGALLLLGTRAALTGMDWWWIALALAASFPPHLLDLRRRGW